MCILTKIAMYGRARVGEAVLGLAAHLGLKMQLCDDLDTPWGARDYDIIIPTPGLPPRGRAYAENNRVSELDFAGSYIPPGFRVIAVTGTDGKSTVAWMLSQILTSLYDESQVYLSGNFEIPLSETVTKILEAWATNGYIIVEVSSFMSHELENNLDLLAWSLAPKIGDKKLSGFTPEVTIFTNFAPDHLDWHGSIEKYFAAKMRLVEATSDLVIAGNDLKTQAHAFRTAFPESTKYISGGTNLITSSGEKYSLSETPLRGEHNARNLMAVLEALEYLGVSAADIHRALPSLTGLPHRLEYIGSQNGVRYVDDSKSTSAQSLSAALASYPNREIVLIAGGHDKWDAFDHLAPLLKSRVRTLICIGATGPAFQAIGDSLGIRTHTAGSMQEAVTLASRVAKDGDTVLLSPGCASFGMFRNYLDRAEQFRGAFEKIAWDAP